MTKTDPGNFFEDFRLGQEIVHATPRSVSDGDRALYGALYGSRFAVTSSDRFSHALGYAGAPLDDLLAPEERYALTESVLYFHAPQGIGRSKAAARLEKLVGVEMTARNLRTVLKLQEMAAR